MPNQRVKYAHTVRPTSKARCTFAGALRAARAAGKKFGTENARDGAKWENALKELVSLGLVVARGYKDQVFELTHQGWSVADDLWQSAQGGTSGVRLANCYALCSVSSPGYTKSGCGRRTAADTSPITSPQRWTNASSASISVSASETSPSKK